jgi:hypothetical protein
MMKPTHSAIQNWESIWNRPVIQIDQDTPDSTKMLFSGIPGDFYRGYGVSYKYFKNGEALNQDTVRGMLMKKLSGNEIDVKMIMNNVDTVVSKYSLGKNKFDHDANFIIYRAADVHLYAAEIYAMWKFIYGGLSVPRTQRNTSLNILNDGSYGNRDVEQMGVRGRVGFADGYEAIRLTSVIYEHDPVTNEITGWENYAGKPQKKQTYLINQILEERARELAFEGERFYDLMRIANRRNDPSFLAEKVASKFSGAKREAIKQKLMNKENWYIDYFD